MLGTGGLKAGPTLEEGNEIRHSMKSCYKGLCLVGIVTLWALKFIRWLDITHSLASGYLTSFDSPISIFNFKNGLFLCHIIVPSKKWWVLQKFKAYKWHIYQSRSPLESFWFQRVSLSILSSKICANVNNCASFKKPWTPW